MKMYYFYLKLDKINDEEYLGIPHDSFGNEKLVLYAFTEKKEYAKEFRKTRNMKIFEEVVHDFNDDLKFESHLFINDFLDCYLEYNNFYGETETDGLINSKRVSILSTNNEYDIVSIMSEEYIEKKIFNSDLTVLKEIEFRGDIEDALDVLNFRYALETIYPTEELNYDILRFNEFELFIRFFGNTFRKDIIT